MNVSDYPVTTPYGQVAGYPLNGGFHTGIDYGCPVGTPVVVNGVTIGLSGNTGASTGPHCHVGRWVGGASTNPGVGNGFQFNSAVVTELGQDATNGKFVRVQGDGASWVYLHLSDNGKVKVGQVLQGGDMADQATRAKRIGDIFKGITGNDISQKDLDFYISRPDGEFDMIYSLLPQAQKYRDTIKVLEDERDNILYPYVNAVSAALNITPDARKLTTVTDAIKNKGLSTSYTTYSGPQLYVEN